MEQFDYASGKYGHWIKAQRIKPHGIILVL